MEDHKRPIQQSTSTHTKHLHNIQNKILPYPNTLRIISPNNSQTLSNTQHTRQNRSVNRATHKIQGYNTTLTTTQVQEAINKVKNNNSQSPGKLNTRHLKHIGQSWARIPHEHVENYS